MSHNVTIRFDFSDTSKYSSIPLYIGVSATFTTIFIYIQSELSPLNVPVPTTPTPAGFLHGHAYEITLKFSSSAITPTVSVVDWVPVTNLPEVEI